MKKLIWFVIVLILTPILLALLFKRIPPATIGVKQYMWGGGIVEDDFPTGFHLGMSGYHKWYLLPAKTHFIHFTESGAIGRKVSDTDSWNPPLNIRTRDNNLVSIDVSVAYKIRDGQAHEIVSTGLTQRYRERVKAKALGVLRSELAKLSSEDLQSTERRLAQVNLSLPNLDQALSEFHCAAEAILIRRISFEQQYESKLQEKQYLSQKANLDVALTRQAEEQKTVNLIDRQIEAAELQLVQDWGKRFQLKRSEYEVLIAQIDADARIYEQRTLAEGEAGRVIAEANGSLAIEKAEALRNQLRTEALNSEGGSILLALEAAENLNMPSVTLNSDDPNVPLILDLGQLTKMLIGITSEQAKQPD
jgi:regulator of protease activity HflC (stomatin/prohibitin superfamily)